MKAIVVWEESEDRERRSDLSGSVLCIISYSPSPHSPTATALPLGLEGDLPCCSSRRERSLR